MIVKKRQWRLSDVDAVAISLYAKGLTTGEISAHFAEVYGASISKGTVSRIPHRVLEEMQAWTSRPLQGVYAVILSTRSSSRSVMVPPNTACGVPRTLRARLGVAGSREVLDHVLTDLENRGVTDVFFIVVTA